MLRVVRLLVPLFCRLRVTGELPRNPGPLILVSNHIGTFDPFVLMAAAARRGLHPRFLATAGLFKAPVFGAIMRASGHIRVDRGSHTVTDALASAVTAITDDNAVVIIYPEGRITLDPGLWPERAKTGAARLALATGAPVVTIAQWGAHEIMCWDSPARMARTLLSSTVRRPTARVHFGRPLDLTDLTPGSADAARRAADRMMSACADDLRDLRVDEPLQPRHIDPTRPLSTSRTLRLPWQRTPDHDS
ncbi:lysophospholipid acyltransferase family protein [Stackebrandtia soli]|uniref:lysophospholipid acyltransferase family protein n=1 Tax=Stackebrandtia soli TaxID=1892856 RepID=UPI0039E805BC